ncbi:MAG TPA: PASTA domain-containing protein [Solirubrobacterales bacterium]|jgi:uncharacterized repeat protein (TIGR01451 family)|nr:PASTA domain-containing protein [Solirubrobacterales bacterium]
MALLMAGLLAPSAQARVESFQALAPSSVPLTAVTTDPGSGLIYAQENQGTNFFVYNPQTNAWSELAPSPVESGNNGGAAYLGGKIYVVYTSNSTEAAVYDIASNSWTTMANPLGVGTGNITAGDGKLYLAGDLKFASYDPATGTTTPLAEPPKFEAAECDEGFEPWGALVFDGSKIYGHQGNGCTGFAVYDIAANSWSELPFVPLAGEPGSEEGAILGAVIDPVTNTYLTTGPYAGNTLFRYDIEAGTWSTSTLPFEVEDNGMAYVSLPGHEGVYIIQGEEGTEFTRYMEKNQTDLSASMSATAVAATATNGEITYSVQIKNNGPERAGGVVLSDPLPAGASLISAGTSQGACTGTSTLSCSLGVLRSGTSVDLTIKLRTGFGTVTNTATVSSFADDSNQANNSSSVVSSVVQPCVVPKLKKLRLKKAKKALRKAHCKPGKVKRRFNGKIKKGKVVRSGKRRGVLLPAGSKVKLIVSKGEKQHKNHQKPKGKH